MEEKPFFSISISNKNNRLMICKKHVAIFLLWHDEDDFFTKNIILFTFFKKTQKLFVGVVLGFIVKIFTKFNFCMFFLDLIGKKKMQIRNIFNCFCGTALVSA